MSRINALSGAKNLVMSGPVNVAENIIYNFHLSHRMTSGAASTKPQTRLFSQCITCGHLVPYSPVESNANGNRGKWLARCFRKNRETGVACKFFAWLPASQTPPRVGSTAVLPEILPPGGTGVLLHISVPGIGSTKENVAPHKTTCRAKGCKSTYIRKGCEKRMCKTHCIETEGCSHPKHKGLPLEDSVTGTHSTS